MTPRASRSGPARTAPATSCCRTRAPTTTRCSAARATTRWWAISRSSPTKRSASTACRKPMVSTSRARRWDPSFRKVCSWCRTAATSARPNRRTSSTSRGQTSLRHWARRRAGAGRRPRWHAVRGTRPQALSRSNERTPLRRSAGTSTSGFQGMSPHSSNSEKVSVGCGPGVKCSMPKLAPPA